MHPFWLAFIASLVTMIAVGILFLAFYRPILKRMAGRVIRLFLTETYSKNVWEIFSSGKRFNPFNIVQNALRSEQKQSIVRSNGTTLRNG